MNTLNLDGTPQPKKEDSAVNVTLETFTSEIVEASEKQLIIVEFWSPQSAASKQLAPLLVKTVGMTDGAAKCARIDVSKYPQIAQQMRVQSIPAVFAFWKGQPVDGFMGAIPEEQLTSWLTKLIQTTGAQGPNDPRKGIERAVQQAEGLLEQGDIATAQAIFEDLSAEFPEEPEIIAGCLICLIKLGKQDEAKDLLEKLPKDILKHAKIISAKAALELASQSSQKSGSSDEWLDELEKHPDNHDARFDYAMHLYGEGNSHDALDQLLEIAGRDRQWNDDGARLQILKIFEALGPMHEETVRARKKLSTILFS